MDTPQTSNTGRDANMQRNIDQAKDKAKEGMDKLADATAPAMDRISSTAQDVATRASDMASQAADVMSDQASRLKDVQERVVTDTRQRIREKPMAALAIAAAAGFVLRHLMKRR